MIEPKLQLTSASKKFIEDFLSGTGLWNKYLRQLDDLLGSKPIFCRPELENSQTRLRLKKILLDRYKRLWLRDGVFNESKRNDLIDIFEELERASKLFADAIIKELNEELKLYYNYKNAIETKIKNLHELKEKIKQTLTHDFSNMQEQEVEDVENYSRWYLAVRAESFKDAINYIIGTMLIVSQHPSVPPTVNLCDNIGLVFDFVGVLLPREIRYNQESILSVGRQTFFGSKSSNLTVEDTEFCSKLPNQKEEIDEKRLSQAMNDAIKNELKTISRKCSF